MSDCSCSAKDKTRKEVVDFVLSNKLQVKLLSKDSDLLGFGLFLVPAPDLGIFEYRQIVVSGLTYKECSKRGVTCLEYEWIPFGFKTQNGHTLDSMKALHSYFQTLSCDDCRMGCSMGCNCNRPGQVFCDINPGPGPFPGPFWVDAKQ